MCESEILSMVLLLRNDREGVFLNLIHLLSLGSRRPSCLELVNTKKIKLYFVNHLSLFIH